MESIKSSLVSGFGLGKIALEMMGRVFSENAKKRAWQEQEMENKANERKEAEARQAFEEHLKSLREQRDKIDKQQDEIRKKLEGVTKFDKMREGVGDVRDEIEKLRETRRQGLAKIWHEREQVSKRIQEASDVLKQPPPTAKPVTTTKSIYTFFRFELHLSNIYFF